MTSQNNTLRCAASTMYSMAVANMPNGDVNAPLDVGCSWLAGIVSAPCSCRSSLQLAMRCGEGGHPPLRQFRCLIISNSMLGSGSVCRFLPPYASYGIACGACWICALRSDCARAGEAITAIAAATMQTLRMLHLLCERQATSFGEFHCAERDDR